MIFETERLFVRKLDLNDRENFFDMMSNPNVMNPIPQNAMGRATSDEHFEKHLNCGDNSDTKVWAIDTKSGDGLIGIAAYLKNNKNEDEIGYRLREQFWGLGYGTEIAKGLLDYGFDILNLELISADVNIENEKSVKILDKFLKRSFDFYNPADACTDRRYKITRKEWK